MSFGAMWPLMVVLCSELFGKKHLGGNYMLYDGYTSAIGAVVLAKFIPEALYDRYADDSSSGSVDTRGDGSSSSGSSAECTGYDCFGWSFVIIAALSFAAVLSALLLHCRNRQLYSRIIAQKLINDGGPEPD